MLPGGAPAAGSGPPRGGGAPLWWHVTAAVPRGGAGYPGPRGAATPVPAARRRCPVAAVVVPRGGGSGAPRRRRWCPAAAAVVPSGGSGSGLRQRVAGLRQERIAGNDPFLLHFAVHVGLLQGVKAKVPFPQMPYQPWLI